MDARRTILPTAEINPFRNSNFDYKVDSVVQYKSLSLDH